MVPQINLYLEDRSLCGSSLICQGKIYEVIACTKNSGISPNLSGYRTSGVHQVVIDRKIIEGDNGNIAYFILITYYLDQELR